MGVSWSYGDRGGRGEPLASPWLWDRTPGSKERSRDAGNEKCIEVSSRMLSEPALWLKMDVDERPRRTI